MARLTNESATKLKGVYNAKFMGFKAVPLVGKDPLIKAIFALDGIGTKLDYMLGSKVDMDKLNDFLKVIGKAPVKSIGDIDVPLEGEIIPADWDKNYQVEVFYPLTKDKVESNFASVKAIVGLVGQSAPAQNAPSIPSL